MNRIPDNLLPRLSELIAQTIGWDFPPARWEDMQRGITAAIKLLGFDDPIEGVFSLLTGPLDQPQIDALARCLTVGETYFFRDRRIFDFLAEQVLPKWIHSHRQPRPLRIWSAACCTGEEPYSIAMLLQQALPDWQQCDITILATDINRDFLDKAEAGIFSPWSFRDVPKWITDKYFRSVGNGNRQILPHIRKMVRFGQLNLIDESSLEQTVGTGAMDLIFCRNVLMYFTPAHAKKVIADFYRAQSNDGWLIVGPTESPHGIFSPYRTINSDGLILYHKGRQPVLDPVVTINPVLPAFSLPPAHVEVSIPSLPTSVAQQSTSAPEQPMPAADAPSFPFTIQSLSNERKFPEALGECDRWIDTDKLNPSSHYTRAVLLLERDEIIPAVESLQRALYIDPTFALAHFTLANIARTCGRLLDAKRHTDNALRSLKRLPPSQILLESDGITAGRLVEIIGSIKPRKVAA